jgi:hypothetical protein
VISILANYLFEVRIPSIFYSSRMFIQVFTWAFDWYFPTWHPFADVFCTSFKFHKIITAHHLISILPAMNQLGSWDYNRFTWRQHTSFILVTECNYNRIIYFCFLISSGWHLFGVSLRWCENNVSWCVLCILCLLFSVIIQRYILCCHFFHAVKLHQIFFGRFRNNYL